MRTRGITASLALAGALVCALVACDKKDETSATSPAASGAAATAQGPKAQTAIRDEDVPTAADFEEEAADIEPSNVEAEIAKLEAEIE